MFFSKWSGRFMSSEKTGQALPKNVPSQEQTTGNLMTNRVGFPPPTTLFGCKVFVFREISWDIRECLSSQHIATPEV